MGAPLRRILRRFVGAISSPLFFQINRAKSLAVCCPSGPTLSTTQAANKIGGRRFPASMWVSNLLDDSSTDSTVSPRIGNHFSTGRRRPRIRQRSSADPCHGHTKSSVATGIDRGGLSASKPNPCRDSRRHHFLFSLRGSRCDRTMGIAWPRRTGHDRSTAAHFVPSGVRPRVSCF